MRQCVWRTSLIAAPCAEAAPGNLVINLPRAPAIYVYPAGSLHRMKASAGANALRWHNVPADEKSALNRNDP
jgi:hypothetical protein